jgi:hypothetical protein
MPVVGTAEVELRAKLDAFEAELAGAQAKLAQFDKATSTSTKQVKQFETTNVTASKALASISAALTVVEGALKK